MAKTGNNIQERAMEYAVRAVKLFRHLQQQLDAAATILARQHLRSASSIGANLLEAQSGESRKDFVHKCAIAQKEAREAKYWLNLMVRSELATPAQLGSLIDVTNQLSAIITTIIVKAKRIKKV